MLGTRRRRSLLAVLCLAGLPACGASPAPPPTPPHDEPRPVTPPAPVAVHCADAVDLPALMALHAAGYGSIAAVRASLPRSSKATIELGGQLGEGETTVAEGRSRGLSVIGGMRTGNGTDEKGPWILDGTGVPQRVSGLEATSHRLDDFLTFHRYLEAPLTATCAEREGRAVVTARTSPTLPGDPVMTFDLSTGALLSVVHTGADGTSTTTQIETWTPPDAHGVRWPLRTRDHDEIGNETVVVETSARTGLFCSSGEGEACLSMPGPEVKLVYGKNGRTRVPFVLDENEIMMRMTVEGREVWGLLDSGASTSALDATRPVVAGFRPALTIEGTGVDQTMKIGLGWLGKVGVGDLAIERLPVASVPLPTLDSFETRRPELILGFTLFVAGTVRIDYAKSEVIFADKPDGLIAKGAMATRIPLRVLDSKPVIDTTIEGLPAVLEVDTGNNGGVQLTTTWADANKLPGKRPVAVLHGIMGAGTQETETRLFRVRDVRFGDVVANDSLVGLMATPAPGTIAGLLGNELFSRCPAVIFDVPGRALWLEGPCTREVSTSRSGMQLAKVDDPGFKGRPFVVAGLIPTGSAERSGLQVGDRLLELDGKPAEKRELIDSMFRRPKGVVVKVLVARGPGGKSHVKLDVKLVDALSL